MNTTKTNPTRNDPETIAFDAIIRPAQEAYDACPCERHHQAAMAATDLYLAKLGRRPVRIVDLSD